MPYNPPMRALGTDPIFSNLIVKKFDRKLHVRLRAASVKYGKSIRKITVEAIALWIREEKRKEKEKRDSNTKTQVEFVEEGPGVAAGSWVAGSR